jgi:hypothetical protein
MPWRFKVQGYLNAEHAKHAEQDIERKPAESYDPVEK